MRFELSFGVVSRLQNKQKDDVGEVFEFKGSIYRGIFPEHRASVIDLVNSEFLRHLIAEGLFPRTEISELSDPRYGIIVWHETFERITYPQEWTFSMLRDAASTALRVAEIANDYGYDMKDCHSLNIIFDNRCPKFVDLGSFYKPEEGSVFWTAYVEFLRCYYYPLTLWSDGLESTAKRTIHGANLMPQYEFFAYKSRFVRALGPGIGAKFVKVRFVLANLSLKSEAELVARANNKIQRTLLKILKKLANFVYGNGRGLARLSKRLKRIKVRRASTTWSDYQSQTVRKKDRFARITELVKEVCPDLTTAIDIAGNKAKFSQSLLLDTQVKDIVCVDLDEQALDSGYLDTAIATGDSIGRLTLANYNAFTPSFGGAFKPPWERFSADGVFALALVHHLLLSQGYGIQDVFYQLSQYSTKYVFIEFPKNGLWRYGDPVEVPHWYTLDWFKANFEERFDLIHEEQLTDSYILFIGKLRSSVIDGEVD